MNVTDITFLENALAVDSELRDTLRDCSQTLEKHLRVMLGTLNRIHSTPHHERDDLLAKLDPELNECVEMHAKIASAIPQHQYWRWKDLWARHIQSEVFVISLRHYLQTGQLLSLEGTSGVLGFRDEWKDRFYLAPEDYLHGVINMVDELGRLAVNLVTMGDFEGPLKISTFVKVREVFSAFTLLNLKNDNLRRRFDSMKYVQKKLEEVVYDVSLRQLVNRDRPGTTAPSS